jgi:hypothetical protein
VLEYAYSYYPLLPANTRKRPLLILVNPITDRLSVPTPQNQPHADRFLHAPALTCLQPRLKISPLERNHSSTGSR